MFSLNSSRNRLTFYCSKVRLCQLVRSSFASKINFNHVNRLKKREENEKDDKLMRKTKKDNLMNVGETIKQLKIAQATEHPDRLDATIKLVVKLGVNPNKGDQQIRGICKFPGGPIQIPRVCVFTTGHLQEVAKEAGADIIGDEQTINMIKNSEVYNFDKLICTLDMLPTLKQLGKVLGPKGLMPNQKVGTASKGEDLESIIKEIKKGSKEFKMDNGAQVRLAIGRINFPDLNLYKNIDSFIRTLFEKRPDAAKSTYIEKAYFIVNRKTKPIYLDPKVLDIKDTNYFLNKV